MGEVNQGKLVEQVLCRAHDIIKEGRWTRHALARKKDGSNTYSADPDAVSFCSLGAIERARHELRSTDGAVYYEAVHTLEDAIGRDGVAHYNDHIASREMIVDKFCGAIKRVREKYGLEKPEEL